MAAMRDHYRAVPHGFVRRITGGCDRWRGAKEPRKKAKNSEKNVLVVHRVLIVARN